MTTKTISSHSRLEFLDGLRGIAAVLVVLYHFNNLLKEHQISLFPRWIDWIFNQGHSGVAIFFVLSGFVIAYSIRQQTISSSFIARFFIKRSLRLDPPYWVIISLLIGLSLIGNLFKSTPIPIPSYKDISINLLYFSDLLNTPRILPVSWTLALEIQFYIFFILVVKSIQYIESKFSKQNAYLSFPSMVLISSLMLLSILQNTSYAILPSIPGLFIYQWYCFFIGCLACWAMLNMISPYFFWINFGCICGYALLGHSLTLETACIAFIIYAVAYTDHMHHFLTSRLFQYLGKISYSLYLIHWVVGLKVIDLTIRFIGHAINHAWMTFALMTFALILSILMADIFYRFVESPSLKLSQKLKINKNRPVSSLPPTHA